MIKLNLTRLQINNGNFKLFINSGDMAQNLIIQIYLLQKLLYDYFEMLFLRFCGFIVTGKKTTLIDCQYSDINIKIGITITWLEYF